jgi:murein L,D-transpeptidase YcbB/YkuD
MRPPRFRAAGRRSSKAGDAVASGEDRPARSGWLLVGLIALAGGLAAPASAPIADPPLALALASPADAQVAAGLARSSADPETKAFYAARQNRPLWADHGRLRPEALRLIAQLQTASDDDLRAADYDPAGLAGAVRAAASGRTDDLVRAELMLSEALGAWGADLRRTRPAAGLLYSDPQFRPPAASRRAVLETAAAAPSLAQGLDATARMNPIYAGLRAALAAERARGGPNVALLRANLQRARGLPADLGPRYILVDVTAQRLWIYENGRPIDTMKVVVGKPAEPTPQMAALVRYVVFRPYWNVPPDLVQASLAPKVLKQGLGYFQAQHLEALSDWTDRAHPIDPRTIDWRAVAGGQDLRVRQQPGPDNMMGKVKFMFPNERGVYLHDSPLRSLFVGDGRFASAGCVRLEDARRLARWLVGDEAVARGEAPGPPETRVDLSKPVPVYIVYFTAFPTAKGLSLRKDVYQRDRGLIALTPPRVGVLLASGASKATL